MFMSGPEAGAVLSDPALQKVYFSACVVTGVLMCFYGQRAFKYVLGLFGLLAGGYAAAAVGLDLSDGNRAVALFCGLTGGALGAVLMVTLYLLGVFVAGATLGGIIAVIFTLRAGPDMRALVAALLAVIGGFLALFIQRFIVTIATALNGAALVIGGMWLLFAGLSPMAAYHRYAAGGPATAYSSVAGAGIHKYFLLVAWALLGCLGAWAQFAAAHRKEEKASKAAAADD